MGKTKPHSLTGHQERTRTLNHRQLHLNHCVFSTIPHNNSGTKRTNDRCAAGKDIFQCSHLCIFSSFCFLSSNDSVHVFLSSDCLFFWSLMFSSSSFLMFLFSYGLICFGSFVFVILFFLHSWRDPLSDRICLVAAVPLIVTTG